MNKSTIIIDVQMDENRWPENISWHASESTIQKEQQAKAFMLSFWDSADKSALRIDLWTKTMMIDEMTDFFYQTLMTMADTYGRATKNEEMVAELKKLAKEFYKKCKERQL